jgi:hypothetical protein
MLSTLNRGPEKIRMRFELKKIKINLILRILPPLFKDLFYVPKNEIKFS